MKLKTPVLDPRTSSDIYRITLELAKQYCHELDIGDDPNYFNSDDPALIILKLFSESTEFLINQFNKIPDKHRLAFLDFMGIDLIPARPAKVPLTFYLSQGHKGAFVPVCTKIASSQYPDVIFETSKNLSVIPARLDAIYSLNPWEDTYTDHSKVLSGEEKAFHVFGGDLDKKPLDHKLIIGDDILFDIRRPPAKLKLHFEGMNLSQEWFTQWHDGLNNSIKNPIVTSDQGNQKLDITFNDRDRDISNIQKLESSVINGTQSYWLLVRPDKNKIVKGIKLPVISRIFMDITVEDILPEEAIFNNIQLDVIKGFFPFGDETLKGDTLYIGSNEVFSKVGGTIIFQFEFETEIENITVIHQWEYWDGNGWEVLEVTDHTEGLVKSDQVIIKICPVIIPTEINGHLNRWIRVRVVSWNIKETKRKTGSKKEEETSVLSQNKLKEILRKTGDVLGMKNTVPQFESFTSPFIKSIKISYNFKGAEPRRSKTYNNFRYKSAALDKPYEISPDERPALYLGFKENIRSMPMTLFFAVMEMLYGQKPVVIKDPTFKEDIDHQNEANILVWKYYNGNSWEEFDVKDETDFFRSSGIINFFVPQDIKSSPEFGKELYWIKAEVKNGNWMSCPELTGIFPNSVIALNILTSKDEVLGSGNGEPGLKLTFANIPVLEGQIIEVKEPCIPHKDELTIMGYEDGENPLRIIEESGAIKEVWVKWREVRNFELSGSLSRHYVLDRAKGTITFGDGLLGMIPPAGRNNILARNYMIGGGLRGNVAAGTLTSLMKSIPGIARVINHVHSKGGMDQENIEKAVERGPYTIKNSNRAVTKEDFEWLAKEASQYVARAKCLLINGTITIIIVPDYEGDTPVPDMGLLNYVETYLKKRGFFTIINRIKARGPDYTQISINVKVKLVSQEESIFVSDKIKERLKTFLHPLKGGSMSKGWDFGESIFISHIATAVEDIEGVDYVKNILLKKTKQEEELSGVEQLLIEPDALPYAGTINVELEG